GNVPARRACVTRAITAVACEFSFPLLGSLKDRPGSSTPEYHHHRAGPHPISVAWDRRRRLPGDDVVRRIERRIDPSSPQVPVGLLRQLEVERLPLSARGWVT